MNAECIGLGFRIAETAAVILGLTFNLILAYLILHHTSNELKAYSRLLLCTCFIDTLFAVWGFATTVTPQANPAVALADAKGVWDRAPDEVKEEYGEEYFQWSSKLIADYLDYKCKPHPEWVVDAYFNALTSVFPRARYQIGYDSTFQFTPLSYLPTRWQDWLFRAYFTYVAGQPRTKIVY